MLHTSIKKPLPCFEVAITEASYGSFRSGRFGRKGNLGQDLWTTSRNTINTQTSQRDAIVFRKAVGPGLHSWALENSTIGLAKSGNLPDGTSSLWRRVVSSRSARSTAKVGMKCFVFMFFLYVSDNIISESILIGQLLEVPDVLFPCLCAS